MNFSGILDTIKNYLNPQPPDPMVRVDVSKPRGSALSPALQAKLDRENATFLKNRDATMPTPQPARPTPTQTVASIVGGQGGGNDLWSQFMAQTRAAAPKRGYDPETIIRQKALESDFGRSQFATERNNFGGIGAYDSDPNQAFNFKDIQDYLDYYFKMVEKRFPEAYANRSNPQKYVEGLKAGNYATDPDYVWKVMHTPLNPR